MHIILITGLSGSGKSVALNALEDIGYYCVDNLPCHFIPSLVNFLTYHDYMQLAVTIAARSYSSLADLPDILRTLRHRHTVNIVFLDASNQTLIQRFSETRRRHPLSLPLPTSPSPLPSSLADAIEHERILLSNLSALGHCIDTSVLHVHTLQAWTQQFSEHKHPGLILMFESFAFKRGVPLDADFVFDARILPNPYYETELRVLTGLDAAVKQFLSASAQAQSMIEDIETFLRKRLPDFKENNRSYLIIAMHVLFY
jgi:RNase adapter protein RapZ